MVSTGASCSWPVIELFFRLFSCAFWRSPASRFMAVFVPSLARSYGRDPGLAFSLGVLNPLVLLFLIGSGHNDALMIGLLVCGLSIARRGHPLWGITMCALAGAVKVPGLIGVFAIAWTSAGQHPSGAASRSSACQSLFARRRDPRAALCLVRPRVGVGVDPRVGQPRNSDELDHPDRPGGKDRAACRYFGGGVSRRGAHRGTRCRHRCRSLGAQAPRCPRHPLCQP